MSNSTIDTEPWYWRRPTPIQLAQLGVLFGIGLLQWLLYYLVPLDIQAALALNRAQSDVISWVTYAYVHQHGPADLHLTGNLVAYCLVVLPAWLLYELENQRRQFWTIILLLLVFVPPVTALLSEFVFREVVGTVPQYSRGFSGVVSALGGVLLISVIGMFERRQPPKLRYASVGVSVLCILGTLVWSVRVEPARAILMVMTVSGAVSLLLASHYGVVAGRESLADFAISHPERTILSWVGLVVASMVLSSIAPETMVSDGSVINIVSHGSGFIIGLVVPQMLANK